MLKRWGSAGLLALCVLAVAGPPARAEDQPAGDDKYRYQSYVQDGKLYMFDRKTGRLSRFEGEKDGIAQFKTWYLSPDGRGRPETHEVKAGHALPENPADKGPAAEPNPKPPANPPPIPNPPRPPIEEPKVPGPAVKPEEVAPKGAITDAMRKAAMMEIADYAAQLSINSMVRTEDNDLAVTVAVRNRGQRTIECIEITVTVPTVGKDGALNLRALLSEDPGYKKPPPPGEMTTVRARIKAPPGGIPGRCEHQVTYIKFHR